jgi:hypothetical protein
MREEYIPGKSSHHKEMYAEFVSNFLDIFEHRDFFRFNPA